MLNRRKYSDRFEEIVEKIITKYDSDEYKDREYGNGYEPRCPLFSFLLNYAREYGRECNDDEYEKHGNEFTGELYFINGYFIQIMHGQGSVIHIDRSLKLERKQKLERITK